MVFLTTSIIVLADENCMPFTSYNEENNELGIAFAPVLSDKHSSNSMQKKIDWSTVHLDGLKTNSAGSYYLATQSNPVCFHGKSFIHCLTVTSSNTAAFNYDENDLGKLKLYDSEEFTQEHLVTFPDNMGVSFNSATVKQYPDKQDIAMGGLNITIPGMNCLKDDQTYYLVIEKGFSIREGKTLPTTVALKFETGHSYVDDVCSICGETKPKPSNNWITFQEGVSYLSSDEQNDYYRIDNPVSLDSTKGFVLSYSVDGAQRYCHVQLQNPDGSAPEGATVSEPDGTSRTATVTSLEYGSNYRFFWDASESNGKLSKNVILKFSTEENSSEPEPDIPDYEQDLVFGDYEAIQPSSPDEGAFGLYFYAIQPGPYNTNKLQESLDASSIKTAGLISIGKEQYYFNSMEKPVCPDVDQYIPVFGKDQSISYSNRKDPLV